MNPVNFPIQRLSTCSSLQRNTGHPARWYGVVRQRPSGKEAVRHPKPSGRVSDRIVVGRFRVGRGTFIEVRPYSISGSVYLRRLGILNGNASGPAGLEDSRRWREVVDSSYPACWYRFTGDGQVEILALGARAVVPIESLTLLPEPIARAVLAELAERLASELRGRPANPAPADPGA